MENLEQKIGLAFEELNEEEMLMMYGGQDERGITAISSALSTTTWPCVGVSAVGSIATTLVSSVLGTC